MTSTTNTNDAAGSPIQEFNNNNYTSDYPVLFVTILIVVCVLVVTGCIVAMGYYMFRRREDGTSYNASSRREHQSTRLDHETARSIPDAYISTSSSTNPTISVPSISANGSLEDRPNHHSYSLFKVAYGVNQETACEDPCSFNDEADNASLASNTTVSCVTENSSSDDTPCIKVEDAQPINNIEHDSREEPRISDEVDHTSHKTKPVSASLEKLNVSMKLKQLDEAAHTEAVTVAPTLSRTSSRRDKSHGSSADSKHNGAIDNIILKPELLDDTDHAPAATERTALSRNPSSRCKAHRDAAGVYTIPDGNTDPKNTTQARVSPSSCQPSQACNDKTTTSFQPVSIVELTSVTGYRVPLYDLCCIS